MGISFLGFYFNIFFSGFIFSNSKTAYTESQLQVEESQAFVPGQSRSVKNGSISKNKVIHRWRFQFRLITAVDKVPRI